jgi:RNA polymerase sigma-70 factor (ECF subfamily)
MAEKISNTEFAELVESNKPFITKICAGYATNSLELDDLVQEVFIQIWKKMHQFRGDAKLTTWIYRIAVNICLYHVGRKKRLQTAVMEERQLIKRIETEQLSESELDLTIQLYRAIKQLEPLDRAIIMLYLEKKTHEEISEIIGTTSTNVGVRIHRCKDKLKKIIHE